MNHRATDPGLENDGGDHFRAHDHQRGEGFGFWNQQRDRKNPIANIVTRDERPGRGMNGIVDRTPAEMNRRVSRFEGLINKRGSNIEGLTTGDYLKLDGNVNEQLTHYLMSLDTVRDVTIINRQNQLLIAVDHEAIDEQALKREIITYVEDEFPDYEAVVVTEREAVDRIRFVEDGSQ